MNRKRKGQKIKVESEKKRKGDIKNNNGSSSFLHEGNFEQFVEELSFLTGIYKFASFETGVHMLHFKISSQTKLYLYP